MLRSGKIGYMNDTKDISPIVTDFQEAGFIVPLVGRTVKRDVIGFPGFPLIRAGQQVTREIAERALTMGRLYELTAATEPEV